ncbi:adenylate kinase 7 [Cyclospora cayetanensis]|uniref:Adenylate kinase 7 n=1 Tax=Cyclospora cayetanensis TaxID=88456 RepID=A0A6P6S0Z5_9EIME|nr:adenylate kinase 7 [Cyclospora cayetanensis]
MRIFIHHVNTYSGLALTRTLRRMDNVLNRLFGTAKGIEESESIAAEEEHDEKRVPVPSCIRRLVSKRNPQQLLQNLLTCSLAVFDLHNTDPDEVEFIFKKLRAAQIEHPLTVILISSLLTWGNTRRQYQSDSPKLGESYDGEVVEESPTDAQRNSSHADSKSPVEAERDTNSSFTVLNADENSGNNQRKLKPRIFSGDNFELRVPPKAYERWKMVETLLMSLNSKENFRGIVISCGMMYGYGEETLYDPFRAAWLGLQTHKVIGSGNNFIPSVHVQDVCTLAKTLALDASKGLGVYHIAVDKAFVTQKEILEAIVAELGTPFKIPDITEEEAALLENTDILLQDLRFECSPLMAADSFPWHARDGFVRSIKQVAAEFCTCRGLRQLKILVTGPPGSGKTSMSQRIAEYYNICLVKTAEVVEAARVGDANLQNSRQGTSVPAEETKKKGKRVVSRRPRYDAETMAKIFQAKLSQNICRYRGFVLDGYPKCYDECKALFLKSSPPTEASKSDESGEEEVDDTAHDALERVAKPEYDTSVAPDFVISLGASIETCEKRLMNLPPSAVVATHNDREGYRRRLQLYQQQNESLEGRPKVTDFFQERGVEIMTLPTDGKDIDDLFSSTVIYIARFGQIRNFLLEPSDWLKQQEQALMEKEANEEQRRQDQERLEKQEEEQRLEKQRERDIARLRRIAEHEQQLLLIRSIPLRRYLMQHIIPTLSEGLLEVCRVLPEDPVSYLAEFLFARARQME